jgi:hypothetical protein
MPGFFFKVRTWWLLFLDFLQNIGVKASFFYQLLVKQIYKGRKMFVLSSFLQGLGDKYISFPVKKFDL